MHKSTSSQVQAELLYSMSSYSKVIKEGMEVSPAASFAKWLRLKRYQFEVTFSMYMLTTKEKLMFYLISLILFFMILTGASLYLPSHLSIIYFRAWYYIEGSHVSTTLVEAVKTTRAALSYPTTAVMAQHTARQLVHEL